MHIQLLSVYTANSLQNKSNDGIDYHEQKSFHTNKILSIISY